MTFITDIAQLEELYGRPGAASLRKVSDRLTPEYRALIAASPFCALATVGPEGVDASPRGDAGEVVFVRDDRTLVMPDRRGNNRMDSLRNIVRDGRVALMFLIPGSNTVVRVNGRADLSIAPDLLARHAMEGKAPRSVIVIGIEEVYFQCARAVMRAGLWDATRFRDISDLPTPGAVLAAMTEGEVGGPDYDAEWPERAAGSMW